MTNERRQRLIDSFARFTTGTISDAMMYLGLPQFVIAGLSPISATQRRTVGFAHTVKQVPRHNAAPEGSIVRHAEVFDRLAQPGDVIVIDIGNRASVCSGGALLALRGHMRGVNGLVVNGCYRDIEECRDIDFPIHCIAPSPVKSHPSLETVGIGVPVDIQGVTIKQGDFIVADQTGVVVAPLAHIDAIERKAIEITEREEKMMDHLRRGCSLDEAAKKLES